MVNHEKLRVSGIARVVGIVLLLISIALLVILLVLNFYSDTDLRIAYEYVQIVFLLLTAVGPGFYFYRKYEDADDNSVRKLLDVSDLPKGEKPKYTAFSSFFGDMALVGLLLSSVPDLIRDFTQYIILLDGTKTISLKELALLALVTPFNHLVNAIVFSIMALSFARLSLSCTGRLHAKVTLSALIIGVLIIIVQF
tara:strand:- start:1849 stop:2436 length:588 start_codon:yes stop_codon:yes gene_type:complete